MAGESDARGGGARGAPPYIYHVRAGENEEYSSGSSRAELRSGGEPR